MIRMDANATHDDKAEPHRLESENGQDGQCGCSGGCCGPRSQELGRREFLKVAGVGIVSTSFAGRIAGAMAGPFGAVDTKEGLLVPADKKLSMEWVRSLFDRGVKDVYSGKCLETIGMPCCGIGTGQLYLCGDGTLGCWQIFNNAESNWVEGTNATYKHRGIAKPVDHGFAITVDSGDGKPLLKTLNHEGFGDVCFTGEYPIGTVRYEEKDSPVKVEMEAFSPFIPLNAKDSALPATLFHITVENASPGTLSASVLGWLQNAVCYAYGREFGALRRTQCADGSGYAIVVHSAEEPPKQNDSGQTPRPAILFEAFEGDSYGAWTAEGTAFGTQPARGTLAGQQPVKDFEGQGLVNSFLGGDDPQGTLTSATFTVNRRFINFLIGGGKQPEKTCINLVVDGKIVRTAVGENKEALEWRSWGTGELEGKEARLVIVDKASGGWGHINIDQIEFADTSRAEKTGVLAEAPDFGTMALACSEPAQQGGSETGLLPTGRPAEMFVTGDAMYKATDTRLGLLRSNAFALAPGEKHTFTFALAWHFPNQPNGHEYANRFVDAAKVIEYVFQNHERLTAATRLWRDTYYDSTLPFWLLDRLHSTVSYLATGTSQWWKNGRFWAWEGVNCCNGTCTHVWNYSHAEARLFPELARSVREMQDFNPRSNGGGFHPETGLVGFRSDDNYAADGQCGTILKAYREHLMSADDAFLKRNWPSIKKALEFSISHDANSDGLIEDLQHNTYDINYFGANTFVGSLYLAALRAGEEMATVVGDREFAARVRSIFESGTKLTAKKLWNGEYFIQDVDLRKHPKHQYKDGCLSDQLFGQGWAHQLSLGYIYGRREVVKALESIWKYNWAPDIATYNETHKPVRWFVSPGQAGLLTCTWPKGDYLTEGTLYCDEVWTGIEYQVAGHMIWEGKIDEGIVMCRAVHDRYHPDLFNPYNEIECGDHYARAMASWGVYLALAGFEYNGPKGWLSFAPRIAPDNFRAGFTTAEAWITYQHEQNGSGAKSSIEVRWGTLKLTRLSIGTKHGGHRATVNVQGKPVNAKFRTKHGVVTISFSEELTLKAGETLEVTL